MEFTLLYPSTATCLPGPLMLRSYPQEPGGSEAQPMLLDETAESLFPLFSEFFGQLIAFNCFVESGLRVMGGPRHHDRHVYGGGYLRPPRLKSSFLARLAPAWAGLPVLEKGVLLYSEDRNTERLELPVHTGLVEMLRRFAGFTCRGFSNEESVRVSFGTAKNLSVFQAHRMEHLPSAAGCSDELAEALLSLDVSWEELKQNTPFVVEHLPIMLERWHASLEVLATRRTEALQAYEKALADIGDEEMVFQEKMAALRQWQEHNPDWLT